MSLPSRVPGVLGETALSNFDVVVIGSGPGGCATAYQLTQAGLSVLVLEAGNNYFIGLDDPAEGMPRTLFASDELKSSDRLFGKQDPIIEPRTFRASATQGALANEDVNTLGRTVGGAWIHADMKVPRLNEIDFRMASALADAGRSFAGTNFADWPLGYDELEPWYVMAEQLSGASGIAEGEGSDPFASSRNGQGYVLPANSRMYVDRVLSSGAEALGYHPSVFPGAINTRPFDGRPACVNCGFCSGYGCPNNSKSSGAVTTLRKALLTGRCQVRFNCFVRRLLFSGRNVTGVEYIDASGATQTASAPRFVLAASPIEDVRLCFLSDPDGAGLGNSSGLVGRNLMFHLQTIAVGIFKQRLHGDRGQSVTGGMSDFRGVAFGGTAFAEDGRPLGGIIEFGTNSEAIFEGKTYASQLLTLGAQLGITLKQLMLESPLRDHLAVMIMQGEDAPQLSNRVDLDPSVTDVYGIPVPRVTYAINQAFEGAASEYYQPRMVEVMGHAGAQLSFIGPLDSLGTRHVLGTLRMGSDPETSVCDPFGKFHDLDNLYCADGAVFVTSSGYNPTLTIIALALRMAGAMSA